MSRSDVPLAFSPKLELPNIFPEISPFLNSLADPVPGALSAQIGAAAINTTPQSSKPRLNFIWFLRNFSSEDCVLPNIKRVRKITRSTVHGGRSTFNTRALPYCQALLALSGQHPNNPRLARAQHWRSEFVRPSDQEIWMKNSGPAEPLIHSLPPSPGGIRMETIPKRQL